jgi:hypothetical protein
MLFEELVIRGEGNVTDIFNYNVLEPFRTFWKLVKTNKALWKLLENHFSLKVA